MQMIPITHNGYMYILVKFGLLGFFLHSYFIYKLIHRRSWLAGAGKSEFELVEKLIAGIGWLILFTTFVISGMFNIFQLDSVLIFLGALMYLSKYQNHGYKN